MQTGKRAAIVVGVSKYEKAQLPDLRFTTNDARRLALVLERCCDFTRDDIHLFCDDEMDDPDRPSKQPTYEDVLATTERICSAATEDDLALFFFAGHGNEISEEPYLLTNNTRLNVIKDTAISVHQINDHFEASRARAKLRIFDACRGGAGTRDLGLLRMKRGFSDALLVTPKGSATLCSCSSGEWATEHQDLEQGLFSYYLCEGLEGAAANVDGLVTLERLIDYINMMVQDWCKRRTVKQTPQYTFDIEGGFPLGQVEPRQSQEDTEGDEKAPLAALAEIYASRMAELPADVRNACPTENEQTQRLNKILFGHLKSAFESTSVPESEVAITPTALGNIASDASQAFKVCLDTSGLRDQFNGASAVEFTARSNRTVLPSYRLTVIAVRFTFAYWIWYAISFLPERHLKGWQPDMPQLVDYFTVMPTAATNEDKIAQAAAELLAGMARIADTWSRQLGEHLNERMGPLRESGKIIT